MKVPEIGLATGLIGALRGREVIPDEEKFGGPSDDIGDVTWTCHGGARLSGQLQPARRHNWANRHSDGDADAHKGVTPAPGPRRMTVLDLVLGPIW